MVLSLTSTLSLFVLMALSTVIFFASKRFKLPYTVMLVLVGILLVPIANMPYLGSVFGFLNDLELTPELLFYIFLPVLIFESAFNMNIRKMVDNAWAICLLAIVGVTIAAAIIGTLLYYLLPLIGLPVPFILALMFGAIISSTDPVAVLSMFKEFGVPRRLGMIFEGESLVNDGTAVALFFTLLAIATNGFHGTTTVLSGIADFTLMVSSGVIVGLLLAGLFSRAVSKTKSNEFVTVTLLIISAHLVFILAETINTWGYLHVSPIIATAVASLFLGNYARHTLAPKVDEYLSKLIEHMAFIVNSLVFLLAGLLFAKLGVDFTALWLPILLTILVVAFARLVSVYAVIWPLNKSKLEAPIPSSWTKLLAWGSLRGALSIIIVLLIPENFTIDGWAIPYTPRDLLLALTIGCILATLFIKAPMIGPIMRRYNIDEFNPFKEAHEHDLGVYYLLTEQDRLNSHKEKNFITDEQYYNLSLQLGEKIQQTEQARLQLAEQYGQSIFAQSLHYAVVQIEMTTLKRLYMNDEVNERTYRKIHGKLCLQQEKIEYAQHNNIDPAMYLDRKDVFDRLVNLLQSVFSGSSFNEMTLEERLTYYRSQMIMARKALIIIDKMQHSFNRPVFMAETYQEVSSRYRRYMQQSGAKMNEIINQHQQELSPYLSKLAECSLTTSGTRALDYLYVNGLVSEADQEEIRHRFHVQTRNADD